MINIDLTEQTGSPNEIIHDIIYDTLVDIDLQDGRRDYNLDQSSFTLVEESKQFKRHKVDVKRHTHMDVITIREHEVKRTIEGNRESAEKH